MFNLGDEDFPGLLKLAEKSAALAHEILKAATNSGEDNEAFLKDFKPKFLNSLADLDAVIEFVINYALTSKDIEQINERAAVKYDRFESAHRKVLDDKASETIFH